MTIADLGKRLFAAFQHWGSRRYAPLVAERKRRLFSGLNGTVLEIGAGTGVNFEFFPPGIRWIGIDPNPHMHKYLHRSARQHGIDIDLRLGSAERIPLPDQSVDAVIATLALCSVDDPHRVLAEVRRVLKPGGRFVFLEHVAAPPRTPLRRLQAFIRPFWMFIGDGCRPDRETWAELEKAGFDPVDCESFRLPVPVVSPHISGIAVNPPTRRPSSPAPATASAPRSEPSPR